MHPSPQELVHIGGGYAIVKDTFSSARTPNPPAEPSVDYAELQKKVCNHSL